MSSLGKFASRFRFSSTASRPVPRPRWCKTSSIFFGSSLALGGLFIAYELQKRFGFGFSKKLPSLKKPVDSEVPEEVKIFKTKANLNDGEKRSFQVGPKEEDAVLIIKQDGKYYCIQDKCSHFGFSLGKGMLFGEKIVCPLHNAVFSIKTGQTETGPVLNGVQTYKIKQQNGELTIYVPKGKLNANKVVPMATKQPEDKYKIVVIGGGPAAISAAETLRQAGYTGNITLISKEPNLPYDRSLLTKNFNAKPEGTVFRRKDFLTKYGINVATSKTVKSVNYKTKEVILEDGSKLSYDKLLIASGCDAVVPPIPGSAQIEQHTLRNHTDLEQIRSTIANNKLKKVTIIGGGFIGVELSSALKMELKDKVDVTIVESLHTPFQRAFGPEVGKAVSALITKNGVKFISDANVKQIKSQGHKVQSVEIEGKSIPTDIVIFATGVRPATKFLGDIQLDSKNGGVQTNAYMKTSHDDVYAAGDVASFPYWLTAENTRIEHFNQAIYQGSIAALNMIGLHRPVDNIPFFWTRFFNTSVQYTGNTSKWDDVIVKGDLAQQKFVAYYVNNGKVVAAATMNTPNAVMIINQAMNQGVMPSADQVRKNDFKLESLAQLVSKKSPVCEKCMTIRTGTN